MSEGKYRKLFFRERIRPLLPVVLTWMIPLLLLPSAGWSQVTEDTSFTSYDSIQDIRMQRFDRRVNNQLEQYRQRYEASVMRSDSLSERLEEVSEEITGLREMNRILEDEVSGLEEALQQEMAVSARHRAGFKRALWIFGSSLTILVVAAFLISLLYSMKTRNLLERLRTRLKRVRKTLRRSLREQDRQIRKVRKERKKKKR